jgi:hypothetical protein
MKHEYDIFEKFPNGSSLWCDSVPGFETTRLRLRELAQRSENQFYAIDLTTGEVLVFPRNAMRTDSAHFQQLKDEARAELLRRLE